MPRLHRGGGNTHIAGTAGGSFLLLLSTTLLASAFLHPVKQPLAQAQAHTHTQPPTNRNHPLLFASSNNNNNKEGEKEKKATPLSPFAKAFTPPSTTNPLADLGEKITSFFDKLMSGLPSTTTTTTTSSSPPPPKRRPRTGGPVTLVFGATGRAGREIVQTLLKQGHDVIAAVRNESKLEEFFGNEMMTALEPAVAGEGLLDYVSGVDVTKKETLTQTQGSIFEGVDNVVLALGPVGGPQPGGGFGFYPGLGSKEVDYEGTVHVIDAYKAYLQGREREMGETKEVPLFGFSGVEDLERWQRLDDVIMGGQSSSSFELNGEEGYSTYKGTLITEGGGFCGTRASGLNLDLSAYDGLRLQVKGDGNRYKLNIKTTDTLASENVYQCCFDTVKDAWIDVEIPWDRFFPVVRNRVSYSSPSLKESSQVAVSVGIVYSRFAFNRATNPKHKPGPFSLSLRSISTYTHPRPSFVLISSAGAERNAKVETDEDRKKEIPIVQLNPGGILNYKYKAETYLRESGLAYVCVRACGLVPTKAFEGKNARLEIGQGDTITGTLTREDLAECVCACLDSPNAVGKTVEVRREEAADAQNKETPFDLMFSKMVKDEDRVCVGGGLLPFPEAKEWEGEVSKERAQEILNDPRVKAQQERDRKLKESGGGEGKDEIKEEETRVGMGAGGGVSAGVGVGAAAAVTAVVGDVASKVVENV